MISIRGRECRGAEGSQRLQGIASLEICGTLFSVLIAS
jgi:hypothetical protein